MTLVAIVCCLLITIIVFMIPRKKKDKLINDESWAFDKFVKADRANPILTPSSTLQFNCPVSNQTQNWEERNVLNPSAIIKDSKVFLLYRAQDALGTSRIGLAISDDGIHFKKEAYPVFYPDKDHMMPYEWNYKKRLSGVINKSLDYFDGVEDPRVIMSEEGIYFMTYTAYDGRVARLALASSKDLRTWVKHGLVLNENHNRDSWSKAGAIVVEIIKGQNIAKKINGKYWMYFGDTNLFMAYSDDLINWRPYVNSKNKLIPVMLPRKGYFDSRLVEPGPFAIYKNEGVLLIYNASNADKQNDPELPKFTYAAGQALFDKNEPFNLIARTEGYFIYPDKDYEKIGEVNNVCFVEGLVNFKKKWFLYYGTADSKIAVAVQEEVKNE